MQGRKQGFCSFKIIFEVRDSPSGRGLGGGFQKEAIIITATYRKNNLLKDLLPHILRFRGLPSKRGNVGRKQRFCSYKSIFEVRNSPSGRGLGGGSQKNRNQILKTTIR